VAIVIHPGLRDRVASIDVFDNDGGEVHVLPSASAVLGFQLRGHVDGGEGRLSPIGVTGIQRTLRTYRYAPETRSVLVRFTPQGATCFGASAAELVGRSVGLDDLAGSARARAAIAEIEGAGDVSRAITVVERLLLAIPFTPDPMVEHALALMRPGDGAGGDEELQVAAVARRLGISERHLERRFRERVGMSPKRLASLRRFELAVNLAATSGSLTRAAVEAGLYEQAHFNREFKRFTGMSPGAWLRMSDSYK
jgi:AraC-like DNA-binding protein